MAERKIIFSGATSADGYLARPDGNVKWLDRKRPKGNYGMGEFMASVDTIVMGRATYEVGLKLGGFGSFGHARYFVFTHHAPEDSPAGVEFVNEPVSSFASRLRGEPGKNVWLMGGGKLLASFLDAGEVDELIVHVVPVLIGEGIPLVAPARREVRLRLLSSESFEDGVVRVHYSAR